MKIQVQISWVGQQQERKDFKTSFDLWFFFSAGSWSWLSRQLSDFGRLWRWRAFGSTKVCESKWWRCRSFRIQHCRTTMSIALNRTLQDSFQVWWRVERELAPWLSPWRWLQGGPRVSHHCELSFLKWQMWWIFVFYLIFKISERDFPTSSWRPSNGVANRGGAVQAESSAHIASRFNRPIYCCWLVSCINRFN